MHRGACAVLSLPYLNYVAGDVSDGFFSTGENASFVSQFDAKSHQISSIGKCHFYLSSASLRMMSPPEQASSQTLQSWILIDVLQKRKSQTGSDGDIGILPS